MLAAASLTEKGYGWDITRSAIDGAIAVSENSPEAMKFSARGIAAEIGNGNYISIYSASDRAYRRGSECLKIDQRILCMRNILRQDIC
jgi:hypothetical protein